MAKKTGIPLYIQILIGMAAGLLLGTAGIWTGASSMVSAWIAPWGRLFIRLLQLIAVPLVFVSLVKGMAGLGDVGRFSKLGGRTVGIYLVTTLVAVLLGVAAGSLVRPGLLVDRTALVTIEQDYDNIVEEKIEAAGEVASQGPLAFLDDIVPDNIVSAAGENSRMLQVIFFAIFFGLASLAVPKEKIKPVNAFFEGVNDVMLRMVDMIIRIAPYGVAALMAGLLTDFEGELSIFSALGVYFLTVVVSLLILIFGFYPMLVKLFTKLGVKRFIKGMYPVQLFAFTTSSSAATLPVNLETVEKELGVSEETASFILPVGTTINMDGTSCYQAVAILFIAQVMGIELGWVQMLTVIFMTVLSSIGTPAIPGGSYVILAMVLTSVGIPAEGLALILAVDRPIDMLRTAVNVTGDAAVAAMVDSRSASGG